MVLLQRILAIVATLVCTSVVACAVTLQAKVVEVQSGNTLIVSNTNRSVRVRLKSVMPPETGQPFSDTARDHLKALVFDKTVTVEYTHLADGYLEARVLLNGIDIGSQMLRDGVAWYDHATDYELGESDRELYAQCEQAARAEKRGLWQNESPVAPWEYRRLQRERADNMFRGNSDLLSKSKRQGRQTVLSNQNLIGSLMSGGSMAAGPTVRPISAQGSFNRWMYFESQLAHFSVTLPSNAVEGSTTAMDPKGQPVAFDFLAAGGDQAFYAVVSGKGANENRTDAEALDQSIKSLIDGMNAGARAAGNRGVVSVKPIRELKLADYAGKQYSLSGDEFAGTARVFTKRVGEERQVYVVFVLVRPGGESLDRQFLSSFKIN
jgi:endonuclease YncB( thermonuclease family)